MKALDEMNNVEKGYLLAKLFPKNRKDLTLFVQQETERFRAQEEYIRSIWADGTLVTADFWFALVSNTEQVLKRHNVMLHRSTRVFSDQLFDGYNAIFLTNCLIEYAEREECSPKLKEAIHLLFGHDKMIVTS
ncbi:hypothetical protein SAMN05421747_12422 [Parapedobacter composti]|uniref:Uncharacterized protein n=1 Tax=Parapedobacter composti TaxID=623281 RepID=A0A1I1LVM5_9SPHI|nr:hypothetical protein [Parapedobacter composti]SFC76966.1 hypothetical protein SAMN05421747_12422 [Parapedobacter composti]